MLINPPRFTPTTRRLVDVLGTECPTCGAGKGGSRSKCLNGRGTETSSHPTRKRMATRARNEALGL